MLTLDRLHFEKMIKALKKVIPKEGDDSNLYVKTEGDSVIFTGGTSGLSKKSTLVKHPNTDSTPKNSKKDLNEFMIPIGALLGFDVILKEHKAICKKLSKSSPDFMFIDIDNKHMISNGVEVSFDQPARKFEDLRFLFEKNKEDLSELNFIPKDIAKIIHGFDDGKPVKMYLCGETIHCKQESSSIEAFYVIPPEEEDPPMGGDED